MEQPQPASLAVVPKTAVFLMNLGGPRTLDEVRPYLFELFSDPKILQLPAFLRLPLAALISTLRAPSSREKYALIGDGSPLVKGTQAQGEALQAELGDSYRCFLAMRCGHPNTVEGVREALAWGAERAVALPLYPQYARPTTLSSLEELRRRWPRERPLHEVRSYPTDDLYVEAGGRCIREALAQLPPEAHDQRLVIFSAHGLPMRDVRQGDPYEHEVKATTQALVKHLGLADHEWRLTYQSRVRPREWLGPDTVATVRAEAKGRGVVLVPVAFVSEHLETLYDLDVLSREAAKEAGALHIARAPAVGTREAFIRALARQVIQAVARPPGPLA